MGWRTVDPVGTERVYQPSSARPKALIGTVVVCYVLATSRWGTQLGVPPLYICDVLIALALFHAFVTAGAKRPPSTPDRPAERAHPGLILGLFLAYVVIRLMFALPWDLTALRDAVPYLYAGLAFASAVSYARSTAQQRHRVLAWIRRVLLFHLAWTTVARFVPALGEQFIAEEEAATLFRIRTDFDTAILGVTAAWYLLRLLRGDARRFSAFIVIGCLALVLSYNSRAGLLATALALAVVIVAFQLSATRRRANAFVVAALPLAFIAALVVLPQTTSGEKLLGGLGLSTEAAEAGIGVGTQEARAVAWDKVVAYTNDDATRAGIGVGFGPNFMEDSLAILSLVGSHDADVRSPHNWLVGSLARLGYVGLVLVGSLLLAMLREAWRLRRRLADDDLVMLSVITPGAIFVTAVFGVVLESPFGAIPFFWFAGILLSRPTLKNPVRLVTRRPRVLRERPRERRMRELHEQTQRLSI